MKYTKFIGLDVHKDSIAVAVAKEGREAAESEGTQRDGSFVFRFTAKTGKQGDGSPFGTAVRGIMRPVSRGRPGPPSPAGCKKR
jgi:hypothetical protein